MKRYTTSEMRSNLLSLRLFLTRSVQQIKISGGKLLSFGVLRRGSRMEIALRNAANAIGRMQDKDLSIFFARIVFKEGRQSAITSTARKLAVIIWKMV